MRGIKANNIRLWLIKATAPTDKTNASIAPLDKVKNKTLITRQRHRPRKGNFRCKRINAATAYKTPAIFSLAPLPYAVSRQTPSVPSTYCPHISL